MRTKGKAVTRDTWVLFIDFVRSIDKDFKDYDEEGVLQQSVSGTMLWADPSLG